MKLRYSLSRLDVFSGNLRTMYKSRALQILAFVVFGTVWWLTFSGDSDPEHSLGFRVYVATFTVLLGLVFVSALIVVYLAAIALKRSQPGVLGEHALQITEEGLRETTAFNETLHRWNGMKSVAFGRRYGVVFVTDSLAHLVPLREDLDGNDARQFLLEVKKKIQAAQPGATDNPGNAQ